MSPKPNFAFIDSQNLNLGIRSQGWKLDFRKFRIYLKNKYNVQTAYLFIGQVEGNEQLYDTLQSVGYEIVLKPTTEYEQDGEKIVKGNVDAELVLYAAGKTYNNYNKAIIVSGDGDFYCLIEYLAQNNKLHSVLVPNQKFSSLLKPYDTYIKRLDHSKRSLAYINYKKTRTSGRSKP